MKTFVVNLDADVGKLASMMKRLAGARIEAERFSAVLGRSLSVEERMVACNRFRIWCAIGRHLEDGELGCALSHLGIYRKMVSGGESVACVLEDDAVFDERLPEQQQRVAVFLETAQPRVVLLSDRHHAGIGTWSIVPAKHDFGTFAYMLNLAAAKAILAANYPVQRPCDHWHTWVAAGKIELYHAYPTVCDYDHSDVSQTATRRKVADFNLIHKIVHKGLRVVGRSLDKVLPL